MLVHEGQEVERGPARGAAVSQERAGDRSQRRWRRARVYSRYKRRVPVAPRRAPRPWTAPLTDARRPQTGPTTRQPTAGTCVELGSNGCGPRAVSEGHLCGTLGRLLEKPWRDETAGAVARVSPGARAGARGARWRRSPDARARAVQTRLFRLQRYSERGNQFPTAR